MKPTEKQLDYIKVITDLLHIKMPILSTKEEARLWIQNHIDEYNDVLKKIEGSPKDFDWTNEILNG